MTTSFQRRQAARRDRHEARLVQIRDEVLKLRRQGAGINRIASTLHLSVFHVREVIDRWGTPADRRRMTRPITDHQDDA